jgi:hypothetical protein
MKLCKSSVENSLEFGYLSQFEIYIWNQFLIWMSGSCRFLFWKNQQNYHASTPFWNMGPSPDQTLCRTSCKPDVNLRERSLSRGSRPLDRQNVAFPPWFSFISLHHPTRPSMTPYMYCLMSAYSWVEWCLITARSPLLDHSSPPPTSFPRWSPTLRIRHKTDFHNCN